MLCEMKSFVKKRNIPSIRDFIQKNYDEIYCIIDTLNNKDLYEISLDYHLRKMTWVSFIVSIYSLIANGFELSKEYSRAIESYKKLISLEYFGVHSRRGDWYERLTCILAINDKPSTIAYLKMAIDQKGICLKKQYKLIRRFLGLIKKNKIFQTEENAKYKESCLNIIDFGIHKEKDFVGKMISNCNIDEMMQKNSMYMLELSESQETKSSSYISELSIEQECITRVEEYALKKYLAMNIYNKGIHSENSTLTFYSGLLFWNEIYYDFIDLLTANDNGNKEDKHVFLSPFQSLPLDFFSNDFYDKRSEIFDKKIEFLIGLPEEGFLQFLKSSYQEHCNHLSGWVNWDMFESVDDVLSLAKCFGSKKLVNISAELIRNPHCLRSGMPDLILWNNTTYEYTVLSNIFRN
ncbi:MAG: Fanconi-associated nuclease 1, variant 2 [Marteilia pararefringens]